MAKYKAYPEYKDSGVEWLGMVPSHWNIKRLGQFFEERRDKVSDKDYPPLSVTMQGIVPQIDTAAKTDAGDNRKLVLKNDFVINSRSDRKGSSGVSQLNGSVSLISIVMEPKRIDPKFAHHLLRSYPFQEEFYRYGKGIVADLWSTNSSEMKNILIPELADDESNAIACFLDHETAKIDNLIEKQQQLIELLKEKRQAVISHAVTKGLNPDVPMKDSGVEWLGEVPEHWTVCRLKQIIKSGTSISYGIVQPGDSLDEGVPFIQTTNISQGNIQLESLPKTSKIIEKNYPRSRLDGGEVILGIRASIGSAYVVPLELKGANLSRGVARIQP
ncbi:restriction endonuclease subunit S, partial [Klebsiella aerogenes]